jgi:hypothetical protein
LGRIEQALRSAAAHNAVVKARTPVRNPFRVFMADAFIVLA